ncbi:sulfotransferase [Magnetospirillum sulfuroxidans]
MILGSHSQAFYMGEGGKARYLGNSKTPVHKRVCKLCGEDCPVWKDFQWTPPRALYQQVAERTGRRVIIDSTKNDDWITERVAETRASGGQPTLFMLLRDGRAVVNSRLRKYPDRDPEQQIRQWIEQIQRSQALYARFDGPKMRLHYEHLAAEPDTVVRQACDVLGLDFEPAMLQFHTAEHHPLGGNSGPQYMVAKQRFTDPEQAFVTLNPKSRQFYDAETQPIRLDLRWNEEMTAENIRMFERIAGEFNQQMMSMD